VDNTGQVLDHITYDSFGNVTSQTHPMAGLRYLFAGREFDSSIGLYYNRARYYDPRAGRFLSEDPARSGGDRNLYRYAGNDPVNLVDPRGRAGQTPFIDPNDPVGEAPSWKDFNFEGVTQLTDGEQVQVTVNQANTLVSGEGGLAGGSEAKTVLDGELTQIDGLINAAEEEATTLITDTEALKDGLLSDAAVEGEMVTAESATLLQQVENTVINVSEAVTDAVGGSNVGPGLINTLGAGALATAASAAASQALQWAGDTAIAAGATLTGVGAGLLYFFSFEPEAAKEDYTPNHAPSDSSPPAQAGSTPPDEGGYGTAGGGSGD
jgi:RHS repeat-associated protein